MYQKFLLTLKWNNIDHPTVDDYIPVINALMSMYKQIVIIHYKYERDSQNKLHVHLLLGARYIQWKRFTDVYHNTGLHINNKQIQQGEEEYVLQYLNKPSDSCQSMQNLISKQIQSEYSFQ